VEVLQAASHEFLTQWADLQLIDTTSAIHVIEALDEASWVQANTGAELRVALLDLVLQQLRFARVYDWDFMIGYRQKAPVWDQRHEQMLQSRLARYKADGIADEAAECTSLSDLEELRDGLMQIQSDRGIPLAAEISMVESRLNDYEEPKRSTSTYEDHAFPENYRRALNALRIRIARPGRLECDIDRQKRMEISRKSEPQAAKRFQSVSESRFLLRIGF
jgi:hypothetical protein